MKANWKIALMCVATLAAVACNKKDKNDPEEGAGGGEPTGYVSPINVKDKSAADWDALDPSTVAVAKVTNEPYFPALKELRVYSDGVYINYLLTYDPAEYTSHVGAKDGMHVYLNVDNTDATGGFFDLFADAAVDYMLEGALFDDFGSPIPYAPTLYKWMGQEGGLPAERNVDDNGGWDVVWEAGGSVKGESQIIGDNMIEGRLLVDQISNKFAEQGFGIGIDIQQNWGGVGLLPQIDAQGEQGELIGRTNMLYVPFNEPIIK